MQNNYQCRKKIRVQMIGVKNMKCKNHKNDCNNATICPCLLYGECDYYCHSCYQNRTEVIEGLYYHKCKLKERDVCYE